MPFDKKEFLNEIVKDICKEYSFEGDVLATKEGFKVQLQSHYACISYTHTVDWKKVHPTANCFIELRREIVFGLQTYILNYFKIKV